MGSQPLTPENQRAIIDSFTNPPQEEILDAEGFIKDLRRRQSTPEYDFAVEELTHRMLAAQSALNSRVVGAEYFLD